MSYTVTREIEPQMIADQIITAIEGGCNYWLGSFKLVTGHTTDVPWYGSPELYQGEFGISAIGSEDPDDEIWHLDNAALAGGLQAMADKYPEHYSNMITGSGDAETADVFLQCCLLGEIVYG
ncbi:MAG: hypothetical protein HQ492_00065 [Woeseiaceae bacterium]|nr:hypothetical protein [Woeseiaceae bacterium]